MSIPSKGTRQTTRVLNKNKISQTLRVSKLIFLSFVNRTGRSLDVERQLAYI